MGRAFLYFILLNLSSAIFSQTINLDSIFEPKLCGEIFQQKTGMVGKQFYNDDWATGDIKLNTGEWAANKQLKYNTFLDEIIWFRTDSLIQIKLEKHFVDEFCLKNYMGKFVQFKKIKIKFSQMIDSTDIFVEVMTEKKASFYIFRNVKSDGTSNRMDNGVLYSFDKLVPQPVYIIILPDKKTITFKKIRKRVLLKALPEGNKTTIKELIQQNHISIRTENDLVNLVNLLN
jgi:hypothetical protein